MRVNGSIGSGTQQPGGAGMNSFRPGLAPTVLVLLMLPLLIGLGVWQLQRAEEKRQLLAAEALQREAPG